MCVQRKLSLLDAEDVGRNALHFVRNNILKDANFFKSFTTIIQKGDQRFFYRFTPSGITAPRPVTNFSLFTRSSLGNLLLTGFT